MRQKESNRSQCCIQPGKRLQALPERKQHQLEQLIYEFLHPTSQGWSRGRRSSSRLHVQRMLCYQCRGIGSEPADRIRYGSRRGEGCCLHRAESLERHKVSCFV
ncbi:hypothetical protein D3C73_1169630 [compost metagenome]